MRSRRYGKGDYEPIVDGLNLDSYFSSLDREHFVQGLANFLRDKNIFSRQARRRSFEVAKKIYTRNISGEISANRANGLVRSAIEEGYVWKFKLKKPWRPDRFVDNSGLSTFPQQHEKSVIYSGRREHIFYNKSVKDRWVEGLEFEGFHNSQSVLKTGYISAGTAHKKSGDEEAEGGQEYAIWFGALDLAKRYPLGEKQNNTINDENYRRNVVVRAVVPSNWIILQKRPGEWGRLESLRDFKRAFDSPANFQIAGKDPEFKLGRFKGQKEGEVALPIKYIESVWSKNDDDNPIFTPFKTYIKYLYGEYPGYMPNPGSVKVQLSDKEIKYWKKKFHKSYSELKQDLDRWNKLVNRYISEAKTLTVKLDKFANAEEKVVKGGSPSIRDFRILRSVSNYNDALKDALQYPYHPDSSRAQETGDSNPMNINLDEIHLESAFLSKDLEEKREFIRSLESKYQNFLEYEEELLQKAESLGEQKNIEEVEHRRWETDRRFEEALQRFDFIEIEASNYVKYIEGLPDFRQKERLLEKYRS